MDILSFNISESIHGILPHVSSLPAVFHAVVACAAVLVFVKLMTVSRRWLQTTRLKGPPSPSFLYGVEMQLQRAPDKAPLYESWARTYGAAYQVPMALGMRRIVLYDPKAIAHVQAKQSWTYVRIPRVRTFLGHLLGPGILSVEGESHRRQRKQLTPAFSNAAIRKLTPIFYDSAHKAKGAWNALIESGDGNSTAIDLQRWMSYISLDVIGLAGFSHNFGALDGNHTSIADMRDALRSSSPPSTLAISSQLFPSLVLAPTSRMRLHRKYWSALEEISNALIARTKQEIDMDGAGDKEENSIIGLLIKAEGTESKFQLSQEELLAQMKTMMAAGLSTTAGTLTWALIELARHPEIQTKLRNELLEHGSEPSYDQLTDGLPYLDAVVHETLRTHPSIPSTIRQATEDDVIPLSKPVYTKSGQLVENLTIAKGTFISMPLASINRSEDFWGEDAKVFRPDRWLEDEDGRDGIPERAKEIQGHRHLLTFTHGPRMCLGKTFAVTELKVVLSVLVKDFIFELPDGGEMKSGTSRRSLLRSQAAGEAGGKVSVRVKPYVA